MRNLFVMPTMGMSTLYKRNDLGTYHIGPFDLCLTGDLLRTNQYVYVTNDEEIDGGWVWHLGRCHLLKVGKFTEINGSKGFRDSEFNSNFLEVLVSDCRKVVMTNDPDLIREDVEQIPDTFFDWFVDNSDCETVNVRRIANGVENHKLTYGYKIYNPREGTVSKKSGGLKIGDNTNFGVITDLNENSVCFGKNNVGVDVWYKRSSVIKVSTKEPIHYDESEVLELLLNRPGPYLTDDEIKEWFSNVKKK